MERDELKYAIEGLLFATEKPLSASQVREAFEQDLPVEEVKQMIEELKAEYETQNRGFRVYEIAGGYQLATDTRFEDLLKRFYQARLKKRLTGATLETLSIIAYRQPVTKAEIEFVRGVNCDAAMKVLLDKEMVKVVGKKEAPGRPILYGTTENFLHHFGLNSTKDLPPLNTYTQSDIDPSMLPPELRQSSEDASSEASVVVTESTSSENIENINPPSDESQENQQG